jgi:hypothetical protein
MQGIYTYIPETNMSLENSVVAILLFLFMVHTSLAPVLNLLHFYISTFRSMCAVPNMAVFYNSLTSWIPGRLLRYFLNDFEMVPVPDGALYIVVIQTLLKFRWSFRAQALKSFSLQLFLSLCLKILNFYARRCSQLPLHNKFYSSLQLSCKSLYESAVILHDSYSTP